LLFPHSMTDIEPETARCTFIHCIRTVAVPYCSVMSLNIPGETESEFVTKVNFGCKHSIILRFWSNIIQKCVPKLLCLELLCVATIRICNFVSQKVCRILWTVDCSTCNCQSHCLLDVLGLGTKAACFSFN
jgi:hypothetical protein